MMVWADGRLVEKGGEAEVSARRDGGARSIQSLIDPDGSRRLGHVQHSAWPEFGPMLDRIIAGLPARNVLEIGGGRRPFFTPEDAASGGFRMTVNDVDRNELDLAPRNFDRVVFDIAADIAEAERLRETFDLIYSRMVFEHIRDPHRAWANVHSLLMPGGIGVAFVPTLYSPPFLINKLIPETVSGRLLRMLAPERNPAQVPKFPAYYHACRGRERALKPLLRGIGFREVRVIPFYGTPYFAGIPVVKSVTKVFDNLTQYFNLAMFASYAYIIVRK